MIIGRYEELKELNRRFASNKWELGIVYGQRRIGKSSILDHFSKEVNGFMYQAKDADESVNLAFFSRQLSAYLGASDKRQYASFQDAFDEIIEQSKKKKFLLIIDEFPYIAKKNHAFLTLFQDYVDHQFKETKMMVVLSGSDISFMKEVLDDRNSPLYKRATFDMHIGKMPFSEAVSFLDGLSNEDKCSYLSIFSTYPYYLSMIDKELSFEKNIQRLLFSRFGTLLNAPSEVLPSGFNGSKTYSSILYGIAKGKAKPKELAAFLHTEPNALSPYLNSLLSMGAIEKMTMFNSGFKSNYYRVSDSLLRFYYTFIFYGKDYISLGGGKAYYESRKNDIQGFLSKGFEDVSISKLSEDNIKLRLDQPYCLLQNYRADNSILGRSVEIDGLASGLSKDSDSLLVVECKYRNKSLSLSVFKHLQESVSIFPKYRHIEYYLFSKSGFSLDLLSVKSPNVHLIDLNGLFDIPMKNLKS